MNRKSINQVHAVKASIENVELTKAGTSTRLEIYANCKKLANWLLAVVLFPGMVETEKERNESTGRALQK